MNDFCEKHQFILENIDEPMFFKNFQLKAESMKEKREERLCSCLLVFVSFVRDYFYQRATAEHS